MLTTQTPPLLATHGHSSTAHEWLAELPERQLAVACHLVNVPVFKYILPNPRFSFLHNHCMTFGVIGDLDRALTNNAREIPSATLLEAAGHLRTRSALVCIKGFDFRHDLAGFRRLEGLPRALLRLSPNYWSLLGAKRRADLMRQRKSAIGIRREIRQGFPMELGAQIMALYQLTRAKASLKLLEHDLSYFKRTAPMSSYMLYFLGQQLIAFHQMRTTGSTLHSQYLGLDYTVSREFRLYFNLLIDCIDYGLERGFSEIDFGITSYRYKQHLGCELQKTWNYFQLSKRHVAWALPMFETFLKPTKSMLA